MEIIKVRDLADPTYVKVKDILPGKSGYNLHVKVVTKNVLIDIVRLDKSRVVIADFVIGDETGTIKMRLRNETFVDIINEGEVITIRNCKVPIVNNHMRMQVDAFGKIEVCNSVFINQVNMEKDLSAQEYDHVSVSRKNYEESRNLRVGGRNNFYNNRGRSQNYNQNYNQNQNFAENKSYQTFSVNDTHSVNTFLSSQRDA